MRLFNHCSKFATLLVHGCFLLSLGVACAQQPVGNGGGTKEQVGSSQPTDTRSGNGLTAAEKEQVVYWVSQLSNDHYLRREKASQKLRELGPVVIPELVTAMNGGDLEVIERSIAVISDFAISRSPAEDGNAWDTLKSIAANSAGRSALAAKSAMKEVSGERFEQAKISLAAAGVFVGEGDFSIAAGQLRRFFVEVGQDWNGDLKVLRWLEWVTDIENVRVTGPAIQGGVISNVVKMPALKAITIADSKSDAVVDDEVFAALSRMKRIESLDIRYVGVTEQQSEIISRLPLRASLTLMGTGVKSEAVDRIRKRLAGLEIQYRQGGFLGVSCYPEDETCVVNKVYPDTAAFDAGLMYRDVIVGAGKDEITSFSTLQQAVNKHAAGDEIEIRFLRGGQLLKAKVRLRRLKEN